MTKKHITASASSHCVSTVAHTCNRPTRVTGQFADKSTRSQSICRLDDLRTSQLVYSKLKKKSNLDLERLSNPKFTCELIQSTNCPVCELPSP